MSVVLLTRSFEENLKLQSKLENYNLQTVCVPLIVYNNVNFDFSILNSYNYVIITSKYAAQILVKWFADYNNSQSDDFINFEKLSFLLVGQESKKIIQSLGLRVAYYAYNVDALIKNIPQNIYDQTIYLSANHITKSLSPKIRREIIYEVSYCKEIATNVIQSIDNGIDYILLYSLNCTKVLINLLLNYQLLIKLENTVIIAISIKVATFAKQYFKNVIYCKKDQQNQMIKLLIKHARKRKYTTN